MNRFDTAAFTVGYILIHSCQTALMTLKSSLLDHAYYLEDEINPKRYYSSEDNSKLPVILEDFDHSDDYARHYAVDYNLEQVKMPWDIRFVISFIVYKPITAKQCRHYSSSDKWPLVIIH